MVNRLPVSYIKLLRLTKIITFLWCGLLHHAEANKAYYDVEYFPLILY